MNVQPWQRIPEQMNALGLTAVDGMTQVWFAHPDGRLTGGAAAVNDALRTVWWVRPFAWLYRLPGINRVEDWVYKRVAENRYRLPGGSAECRRDEQVKE